MGKVLLVLLAMLIVTLMLFTTRGEAVIVTPVLERIAQCETHRNDQHSTRDYISRYGIFRPSWNEYRPKWVHAVPSHRKAGERIPTRKEQDAVANSIARTAGLTAWGCYRQYSWVRNG